MGWVTGFWGREWVSRVAGKELVRAKVHFRASRDKTT